MGKDKNSSFDAFIDTVLKQVSNVNAKSRAIGNKTVLMGDSKLWKDYKKALEGLQDCIKHGQAKGHNKHAVKNCICEFVYKESSNGLDDSPLLIEAVRLRGWVEVSPSADDGPFSSVSSSSSAGGGGG